MGESLAEGSQGEEGDAGRVESFTGPQDGWGGFPGENNHSAFNPHGTPVNTNLSLGNRTPHLFRSTLGNVTLFLCYAIPNKNSLLNPRPPFPPLK